MPDEQHFDAEQSLPARFEAMVRAHGSREAVGSGSWRVTYEHLNASANALAGSLVSKIGAQGDRTAILMRHDGPLFAAMLAVLKAGRVVVVLNASDPPARLREILADAEPTLIITDATNEVLARSAAQGKLPVHGFDENAPAQTKNFTSPAAPGDLAFVIYTSGSTGKPKGVMQTHRNILHNRFKLARAMNLTAEDRIVLLASPSGAQGVATVCSALLNGAALCPFPVMEKGVTGLADWMRERGINVYVSSASLFRNFMRTLRDDERLSNMRLVRIGSERCTAEDFAKFQRHFREDCVLLHTFASSEAGNIARFAVTAKDQLNETYLPVGHPAEDLELLLLDEDGRNVRPGRTGEIVLKSRFLSPGYWRNETLTAQRFAKAGPGELRLFHTGDLGRLNDAGLLMHAGRKDAQVKIRGYRVEISEIEDALASLIEVDKAVVCARVTASEDAQLIAAVIPRAGQVCTSDELRSALRNKLPGHMVPAAFVFLEKFPLTPHGKIDREALRKMAPALAAQGLAENPATETEAMLAGIWRQVFGRESIGRQDDFFDLGGDSLSAAVAAARIFDQRGIELDLRAFVECPTLADLATKIDALARAGTASAIPRISPAPRTGPIPLSFQQEQTWINARRKKEVAAAATMARSRRIRGPLEVSILQECLDFLVRRHEMLRTTFDEIDGQPVQIIQPSAPVPLPRFDFSGLANAEDRAKELLREQARLPFDLKRGPLVRFALARIGSDDHCLIVVSHHIATDAWSWKLFFQELGRVYEARQLGQPPPMPESPTWSYADYAAWQRKVWQPGSPAFAEDLAWWSDFFSRKPHPVKSAFAWGPWFRKWLSGRGKFGALPVKRLWRRRDALPGESAIWWGVDAATSQRLEQIGRQERATFYMTRLAGFTALLAAEAGRPDVALGIYLTQRSRLELQEIFGYFVNHAAIRVRCEPSRTFREWLAEIRRVVGDVQAHGEIPFERLRAELHRAGIEPVKFRVYFNVTEHMAPVRFGGLEMTRQDQVRESMPLNFAVGFDQHDEERGCLTEFDARIYHPARVKNFLNRLARLLTAVSLNPDRPLGELTAAEKI